MLITKSCSEEIKHEHKELRPYAWVPLPQAGLQAHELGEGFGIHTHALFHFPASDSAADRAKHY